MFVTLISDLILSGDLVVTKKRAKITDTDNEGDDDELNTTTGTQENENNAGPAEDGGSSDEGIHDDGNKES